MPTIGPLELLVILIIALIVFGPKRLPELGASLGKGIREFRSSVSGAAEEEPEERYASQRPELQSSEASREEAGGRVDDEDLARQKRE